MQSAVNPTLHTAALAAIEAGINRALALDPVRREELLAMRGQVFYLQCTAPALDIYLQPGGEGVQLSGIWEGSVTTGVRGEASDFVKLASAEDPAAALINGNLELQGDSSPLIELQQSLARLDMDWEAPLVNTLGDVVGHQLATVIRGIFRWSKQASTSVTRQVDEFIHEEARLCPPRLEVEDFYADLQKLNLRVERLQARTKRLLKRARPLIQGAGQC